MSTIQDAHLTGGSAPSPWRGLLHAVRPRQWPKNLLVFAAPTAAGLLGEVQVVARLLATLLAFVAASSAVYLYNDLRDVDEDRAHPTKRHRPVASGALPVPWARTAGVVLAGVAAGLCVAFGHWATLGVIAVYVALNLAYSSGLKHVPLLEMFVLASGFVLRALAGAMTVDVPVSSWFLIVVSAGALHVTVSKRLGELLRTERTGQRGRAVLGGYSVPSLTEIRTVSVGVALTAYMLWAFTQATEASIPVVFELSALPFALAMFRFSAAAEHDGSESPEEILLSDRWLLAYAAAWAVLFGLGLLLGASAEPGGTVPG